MTERPLIIPELTPAGWPQFPHCDHLVLHLPEECRYCADAVELQADRERLEVSNTGAANRPYPCPSTQRRPLETIHRWPGNRPT